MNNFVKYGAIPGLVLSLVVGGGLYFHSTVNAYITPTMVSFVINGSSGDIDNNTDEIEVILPESTNLTALVPTFNTACQTQSPQACPMITVNKLNQYSGISAQNFESSVNYVLTSANGARTIYNVQVIASGVESYIAFQSFGLNVNNALNYGVINGSNINIEVPSNINLESIIPSFNFIGDRATVNSITQYSNVMPQNYSSPLNYVVYANDGTPESFTVNVSQYAPTDESITYFNVITANGIFPGTINEAESTITVGIPSNINPAHLIANFGTSGSSVKVGESVQKSGLTINDFTLPVIYNVTSGNGATNRDYTVTVNTNYAWIDTHNLSDTMFDKESYTIGFNAVNETGSTVTGVHLQVSIESPFVSALDNQGCNNISLDSGESCEDVYSLYIPESYNTAIVDIKMLNATNDVLYEYNKIVTGIPQITELEPDIESPEIYAAYRVIANTVNNNRGIHEIYGTATVNAKSICFDNNYVGTIEESGNGESWASCAKLIRRRHDTFYIPAYPGVGGKILYSIDGKIPDGPTPSVTSTNPESTYYTIWQQVEYGGGLNGASESALFNLNPTNVNYTSIPTGISTVISGEVGIFGNNSDAYQGLLYSPNISVQTILAAMQNGLANVPNALPNSWESLTYYESDNVNILRILSPSQVFPFESGQMFYFNGNIYNQYISDLWAYYTDNEGGHYLYSNDDPVARLVTPGATCTLRCQVTHVDNLMHCEQFSGTCPTNSSSGTLDGAYNLSPTESSESGFTEFTPLDFVSSAGTPEATTFGVNGTYRSVTGENIVAGQAVGFLPFCSDESFVLGNPQFVANTNLFFTPQYDCLTNYMDYTTSVIFQYSLQSSLYFAFYNYGYSDTIGEAGALYSFNNESYPFSVFIYY